MKKIATLLTAIVVCLASTVAASAQNENTLPKEFYGCTLGQTTNNDVASILKSHGFVPGDYGRSYYITFRDKEFNGTGIGCTTDQSTYGEEDKLIDESFSMFYSSDLTLDEIIAQETAA